jgi:hypothetical protein
MVMFREIVFKFETQVVGTMSEKVNIQQELNKLNSWYP